MDYYAAIVRYINFPFGLFVKGQEKFYKHYQVLERTQWASPQELRALQWSRLAILLRYAYAYSPYWRTAFECLNIIPNDVTTIEHFQKLPILTKKILQTELNTILSRNIRQEYLIENASGGSTGEPTIFYQDKERNYRRAMDQIRHDRWTGWKIGERSALLWGANYELKKYESWIGRLNNALFFRGIPLDAFNLTEQKMQSYLELLKRKMPTVIQAYAQAIALFAQFIKEQGLTVAPLKLKGIISSAEKLYPWQRAIIEEVFECKVFDRYGSREVGLIASECNRFEGMHINSDNVLVEFLREDGTPCKLGEIGRIVVTDLWNKVTPFIRYDTGDLGKSLEQLCSCGRGLPLMQCVEGRTSDFIRLSNGKIIHGEYFTHLFYGIRGVKQFQLIQTAPRRLELNVVKTETLDQHIVERIVKKLHAFIDDSTVEVVVMYTDQISPPLSGKRRFTISKLSSP